MDDLFNDDDLVPRIESYITRLPEGNEKRWLSAAYLLSGCREEFTVEDIRFLAGDVPTNAEGPIMLEAKRLRIIKPLRYVKSTRAEAKGRRIPVYTKGW